MTNVNILNDNDLCNVIGGSGDTFWTHFGVGLGAYEKAMIKSGGFFLQV